MKSWDAIIVGGGIIGLSLAISLRKEGLRVLVIERGEPGREASWAAAGMLAGSGSEIPKPLKPLAVESARMYPEFVHELEDESGMKVDLRDQGTILISRKGRFPATAEPLTLDELGSLEPAISASVLRDSVQARTPMLSAVGRVANALSGPGTPDKSVAYLQERCLDPRALVAAVTKAARHHGVNISSGTAVEEVLVSGDHATGVRTDKSSYSSQTVINCAGAWAGRVGPQQFPVHPVKGQMLAVVGGTNLRHVVRGDSVYLVPRSDGRIVIGSTLEDAGYDKRVEVNTIQHLFHAAVELAPALAEAKKHEDWAGLRPGTPDELPILGGTATRGYFIASGHYRDGILLAPITARVMTELILKRVSSFELTSFSPQRFQTPIHHGDTESRREAI